MSKKNKKIIRFSKKLNIGVFIVAVIAFYVVVSVIIYATSKKTVIYEVSAGSLSMDNIYTAFIVRNEELQYAEYSGTFNHYMNSNDKANYASIIYSIDEAGRVSEQIEKLNNTELSKDDLYRVADKLGNYTLNYKDTDFKNLYALHTAVTNSLAEIHSAIVLDDIREIIMNTNSEKLFHTVTATSTGIISFTFDDYCDFDESKLNEALFDNSNYQSTTLQNNDLINVNDPAYRIIYDDSWYMYIPLDETEAANLMNDKTIKLRFVEMDFTCNANFSVIVQNGKSYGKISLNKYMINFANDRYVKIELEQHRKSGLKVPVSSVFLKSFYTIPKNYLSDSKSFVRLTYNEKGEQIYDSVITTIYDEDDNYYYVSMNDFSSGEVLIDKDDQQFVVGTIGERYGVYCVNRGYAVFKIVNILDSNNEYYIVEKGSTYGLAVYDHIVLDYSSVKENEIIE